MANYIIHVSNDALMEMIIGTLEAYVIPRRAANNQTETETELETYGLLWGHEVTLPDGDILYSIDKLTIDGMADRRIDSILPSDGLEVVKDVITSYFPQHALLGDFHSHPYPHYTEVKQCKGYHFSEDDLQSMLASRQHDSDFRVSLVMTIAALKRCSEQPYENIAPNIACWTFNNYRFWLTACVLFDGPTSEQVGALPNSPHWSLQFLHPDIDEVLLHCPYLQGPWQVTRFGKKVGQGQHRPGDVRRCIA